MTITWMEWQARHILNKVEESWCFFIVHHRGGIIHYVQQMLVCEDMI